MPDIQNIDVSLLRAFNAVAETGRMTTAAKIVHRTQGAISQQIKRLETQFDARLFDRKAGSASLTREGEKLLVNAHRLISLNDEVMDRMRTVDFSGGATRCRARCPGMMPPVLRRFRQSIPMCS
jgi:DNA-binding transcriptional LysR family regulator